MEFLKTPFYNALFSGIIIYFLIKISNKGDPVLGAILSSLPIGLFGLYAIKEKQNIQKFYKQDEKYHSATLYWDHPYCIFQYLYFLIYKYLILLLTF